MKKITVLALVSMMFFAYGFAGPSPQKPADRNSGPDTYILDDFEDGNYTSNPVWWKFKNVNPNVVDNADYQKGDPISLAAIKKYSLSIIGNADNWYAGGIGMYVAHQGIDVSKYNAFQMDVYGYGAGSGTIKIELNDDDNGNWTIESDPNANFASLYDDKFVYTLIVDWSGWKRVVILIADFVDENPGVGDDIWNPEQAGGSAGLIQMQFICIGSKKYGVLKYNIDNIALAVKK